MNYIRIRHNRPVRDLVNFIEIRPWNYYFRL